MYANQSNNPNDLHHYHWNQRQAEFQRLAGGSWSQPNWDGYHPITGAGYSRYGNDEFLQRHAQDGDSGFFFRKGIWGGNFSPFGDNLPLNRMDTLDELNESDGHPYSEPKMSTIEPDMVEPIEELDLETGFTAEPQQRAAHVPPYSQMLIQGMGKEDAMYEEPLQIPPYKGTFHKKKNGY
jgi:hypothetical protein